MLGRALLPLPARYSTFSLKMFNNSRLKEELNQVTRHLGIGLGYTLLCFPGVGEELKEN